MVKRAISFSKNILLGETTSMLRVSLVLMVIMLATKVTGLVVKALMANQIGVNRDLDIFFTASIIPEMLTNILLVGAISAAVIPVLSEVKNHKGREDFDKTLSLGLNFSLFLFIIFAFIAGIFANELVSFTLEKISSPIDPYSKEEISRIVLMTRVMLIPQIFLGVSAFLSAGLQTLHRFVIPQLAGFFYAFGQLLVAILILPLLPLEYKTWGLVAGMFLGVFFHLGIQLPLVKSLKIKYVFSFDFSNKYLRQIILLSIPRTFSLAADQFASTVDKVIALQLLSGSLSGLVLAITIMSIPFSLVAYSFSSVAFPRLADKFALGDKEGAKQIFIKVFNQILFLVIPITAIFLVLRVPLVRLLYGLYPDGEFTWNATLVISWMVLLYSFGLIPEVLNTLFNRVFFSAKNTVIPMLIGFFVVSSGIITGILFSNYFKHFDTLSLLDMRLDLNLFTYNSSSIGIAAVGGLALSSSFTQIIAFILFLTLINFKLFKLTFKEFWFRFIAKLSIGFSMFSFMYILSKGWEYLLDTAKVSGVLLLTTITILLGLIFYLLLGVLFKVEETEIVKRYIKKGLNLIFSK